MAKLISISCFAGAVVLLAVTSHAMECSDRHLSCPTWAARGECYTNRGYMWIHCAESCHQCIVQDDNCKDTHDQCPAWANNGECQKNYTYMRKACARACNFCLPANNHNVPYVHSNLVDSHWEEFQNKFPSIGRIHK